MLKCIFGIKGSGLTLFTTIRGIELKKGYFKNITVPRVKIQCPNCGHNLRIRRKDNKNFICFLCKQEFSEDEVRERCAL